MSPRAKWFPVFVFGFCLLVILQEQGRAQQWSSTGNDISNVNPGNVGIGTETPTVKLDVTGDLHITGRAFKDTTGGFWILSDAVLKKNVEPIRDALGRLLSLSGVTFHWREPSTVDAGSGRYPGFIAQDVEKVFPEWVLTTPAGLKAINPVGLDALVVEALRELNAKCERLEAEVAQLRAEAGAAGAGGSTLPGKPASKKPRRRSAQKPDIE